MGRLDTSDLTVLKFVSNKGQFEVPYRTVTSIEYGQNAALRLGIALTIASRLLLSRKKKHFLTIRFKDPKLNAHGVVLEVPKGRPRAIITTLEVRSGLECKYESDGTRRYVKGSQAPNDSPAKRSAAAECFLP